uniref:Uncharacterized protein n=1 Tax=Lepeophtheirus salmonis TaxID=72036 RepID=A0A0K2UIQ2_LEPSM
MDMIRRKSLYERMEEDTLLTPKNTRRIVIIVYGATFLISHLICFQELFFNLYSSLTLHLKTFGDYEQCLEVVNIPLICEKFGKNISLYGVTAWHSIGVLVNFGLVVGFYKEKSGFVYQWLVYMVLIIVLNGVFVAYTWRELNLLCIAFGLLNLIFVVPIWLFVANEWRTLQKDKRNSNLDLKSPNM